tara:strand:- start:1 stop:453 length:453 start_codon:yes stop_codon:yes gene_type:complete
MGSMGSSYDKDGAPNSEPQLTTSRHPPSPIYNENKIDRINQMKIVQKEGLELFKKKNADYGDAFANYGAIGVLVRMGDKISRCQSISNKSVSMVDSESLRDTLIDLHNYAAMAIMLIDEGDKNKVKLQRSITTTSEIVNEVMKGNKVDLL